MEQLDADRTRATEDTTAEDSAVEDTEVEKITLDEVLSSLRKQSYQVDSLFDTCWNHFKLIRQKAQEETGNLSESDWQPKARTLVWLQARNLDTPISFHDFFQNFLEEHRKEDRCNLSERSIRLNPAACELFGFRGKEKTVHLLELLGRLPMVFS